MMHLLSYRDHLNCGLLTPTPTKHKRICILSKADPQQQQASDRHCSSARTLSSCERIEEVSLVIATQQNVVSQTWRASVFFCKTPSMSALSFFTMLSPSTLASDNSDARSLKAYKRHRHIASTQSRSKQHFLENLHRQLFETQMVLLSAV